MPQRDTRENENVIPAPFVIPAKAGIQRGKLQQESRPYVIPTKVGIQEIYKGSGFPLNTCGNDTLGDFRMKIFQWLHNKGIHKLLFITALALIVQVGILPYTFADTPGTFSATKGNEF